MSGRGWGITTLQADFRAGAKALRRAYTWHICRSRDAIEWVECTGKGLWGMVELQSGQSGQAMQQP